MKVILLGTAAGGGFPQWNCWCSICRVGRTDPERARPRTQSSVAVSSDGARWFLLNASPDIHRQVGILLRQPADGPRHMPVEGIVLTDAELDHTLGLVLLREGRTLQLWGTCATLATLEVDSRLLPVSRAFAEITVAELPLGGEPVPLLYRDGGASGLSVEAFAVPAGPPRFASADEPGHTVGLLLRESAGGTLAYAPACGGLSDALLGRLAEADLVLFDGTFWTDDELIRLGIGDRTARQMDHLPVSGNGGSLEWLAALPAKRRVYVHINNTNPILLEDSSERAAVERAGLQVGSDGMTFEI